MNTSAPRAEQPNRATALRRSVRVVASCMATVIGVTLVGLTALPANADTRPLDPASPSSPVTASPDVLPTVQVDGVVWQQTVVGNTVYAVGQFTTARPAGSAPGVNTTPRNNILAFDIRTGALITSFNASLNAQARSVTASPDGKRIYVGGAFTQVNGVDRRYVAALDPATGALISSFAPLVNSRVNAIVATPEAIYMGGWFSGVGSAQRDKLAAFAPSNAALLPWNPVVAGGDVTSLVVSPDRTKVVAGGNFTSVNGSTNPGTGWAAINTSTSALEPWLANGEIRNSGTKAAITGLTSDAEYVYASGYDFAGIQGAFEGVVAARWSDGAINWLEDCHGDTYAVWSSQNAVYSAGHAHYCGNIAGFPETKPRSYNHALAFGKTPVGTITRDTEGYRNFEGKPHSALLNWWPTFAVGSFTGQYQATWSVTGNSEYVVMGGEFPSVSGVRQQGLVRFGVGSRSTNTEAPEKAGRAFNPSVISVKSGEARIRWAANWDRDNKNLTYRVYRNGNLATPVYETTQDSTFWQMPTMNFVDKGLVPGSKHNYRVFALDSYGNEARSESVEVTIAAADTASPYASSVLDDGASSFWRLGEASGTNVVDWAGFSDLTAGAGVTRGETGAIPQDADKASTFNGTGTGLASGRTLQAGPTTYTSEAWIKTTTTSGGKIIGYGTAQTGNSNSYDRHTYMDNAGRVWFGVYSGAVRTVNSTTAFNDGQWHHVVSSLGPAGMALYIDGKLIGKRSDTTKGQAYQGVWRIGGDNLNGWPGLPTSYYFNGTIDEVAVYPRALEATEVEDHYRLGTGTPVANKAPVAAATVTAKDLTVAADGSGSSDPDGTIASYSWDFGDDTPAQSGATTSHTYAAGGTYQVVLTVTDDKGATNAVTKSVTVTASPVANKAPVAAATVTAKDLTVAADGSGSSDPDGTIASYSWDFGDDTPAQSGATTSHTYAAAGTYQVVLTVTDDKGATNAVTKSVTVTAPPVANKAPVAAATLTAKDLTVAADGSGSSDPDGTIASYSWDFGDDTPAQSGATTSHTYAAAGTYQVVLTVTDDKGATNAVTKSVTVTAPPAQPVAAKDLFDRTTANAWGSAETGGNWTIASWVAAKYSVGTGAGIMASSAGATMPAQLNSVSVLNSTTTTNFTVDKVADGGGLQVSVISRRVPNAGEYRAKALLQRTGAVTIELKKKVGTTETLMTARAISGLTYAAGETLTMKVNTSGAGNTTVSAKIWKAGTPEPAAWQIVSTDATAALQAPGSVGVETYLSGSATNGPVGFRLEDFLTTPEP